MGWTRQRASKRVILEALGHSKDCSGDDKGNANTNTYTNTNTCKQKIQQASHLGGFGIASGVEQPDTCPIVHGWKSQSNLFLFVGTIRMRSNRALLLLNCWTKSGEKGLRAVSDSLIQMNRGRGCMIQWGKKKIKREEEGIGCESFVSYH